MILLPPWEVTGPLLVGLAAVITAIATLWAKVHGVEHEVRPNHGESMRDAVDRSEVTLTEVHTLVTHNVQQLQQLRSITEQLAERVALDEARNLELHRDTSRRLTRLEDRTEP